MDRRWYGSPDAGHRAKIGCVDSTSPARVTFYTRIGCHLCETARSVVADVCRETGDRFQEIDVDDDPALLRAYTDKVPVVAVDGTVVDFWRVDPARLRARLQRSAAR